MTMRRLALFLAAASLLPLARAESQNESRHGANAVNLQLVGGWKFLNNDWKPSDDQVEFGLQTDFTPTDWPVAVAAGFLYGNSAEEQVTIPAGGTVTSESDTAELNLGIRKYFIKEDRHWRPFLGGGLSILRGEIKLQGPTASDSDSGMGVGFWAGAGTLYTLGKFVVGAQAQYTQGQVKVFGDNRNAGGVHVDGLVGVTF